MQAVPQEQQLELFYKITFGFITATLIALYNEVYWLYALPFTALSVLLAFVAIDKLLMLTVFVTPWAVNITDVGGGFGLSVPSEPLILLITLVFVANIFIDGRFDRRILTHPVSWALLIYLCWLIFTSVTSSLPLVSLKFTASKIWYVLCFYMLGTQVFSQFTYIRQFVWLYCISMIGVVGYTIYTHYGYGFDEKSAHWVMSPFYNDHTAYAAALAMFLPIMLIFMYNPRYNFSIRATSGILSGIIIIAIVLSYSRAAWVSLAGALLVFVIMKLRIRFTALVAVSLVLIGLFFAFKTSVLMQLEKNQQDTSTDFANHLKSITNISTDASNLERLNRWNCAFRMFHERPIVGWGPGTYKFQYAPFQISHEMTIISTNAGDKGNAHSEYIGPLCETGLPGLLTFLALLVVVSYTCIRVYTEGMIVENRFLTMGVFLGLVTYLIHGFLNNFLDTDKASVPFWGFIGIITALDVYHKFASSRSKTLHPGK